MNHEEHAAERIAQFCRNQVNVKRSLPIRSSDMGVMIFLLQHPFAKAKDISDFFDVAPATVAEMIQRLVTLKMIIVDRDTEDARVKRIQLSESGKKFVVETRVEYLASIHSMKECLGEKDFETFITLIQRINESRVKE